MHLIDARRVREENSIGFPFVGDGFLLSPLFIPIPLMLLGVFTSAIQALVFATLAGAYIGESIEDHH